VLTWQWRREEYQRQLEVVRTAQPVDAATHPWFALKPGEVCYWVGAGVKLVERRAALALPTPVPDSFFREQHLPAELPKDVGMAAVTNQRVVFHGAKRREWVFLKLTGIAHTVGNGPTWMRVSNRKWISGLSVPAEAVGDFRLAVAVGAAEATGQRSMVTQWLREQISAHERLKPVAPAVAQPEQAPWTAWFTGPRMAFSVTGVVLALVLGCCGFGAVLNALDPGPETGAQTAQTAPAPETSPPSTVERPARPVTPRTSTKPTPATPTPSTAPTSATAVARDAPVTSAARPGDCAAYVDSGSWCVDGIGDYDCEGGSGDGPNYAPRGVRLVDPKVDPFGLDHDGDGVGCEGSGRPPAPAPPPPPPPDPGTDPRFSTCREAKAAGYGPYYRGKDPEYHWYRDADNDGVVCE